MPLSVKLEPYDLSHELELQVSDPYDPTQEDLDLEWLVTAEDEEDFFQTLNLKEGPDPWKQLRLQLTATLPEKALEEVLPSTSDVVTDTILVVSIRCPSTKLRRVAVLEFDDKGRWSGETTIDRVDVRNVVELHPVLARKTDLPRQGAEIANKAVARGATIAQGRAVRIVADESRSPVHGALEVYWEDFRVSDHPWRKEHPSDLYYLDLSSDDPTLYLNERYASFKAALHGTAPQGVDAVIRHLGNGLIAQTVWLQLYLQAAGSIELDEELGTVSCPPDWRYAAVGKLGSGLFPESPDDDRFRELAKGLRSPDQIGALLTRAGTIVQETIRTYRLTENAVRAGEKD